MELLEERKIMPINPYDVPVSQSWQGYTLNPEDPVDTPLDDAVENGVENPVATRPMRVSPMYNFMKGIMGAFHPSFQRLMKERMTSYWNPQTNSWDKDPIENITYGPVNYYNFETNEYERPENPVDPSI